MARATQQVQRGLLVQARALRVPRFAEAQLEQVTSTAWRVCDARVEPGDPGRLLGCIDRHGDVFELMQIGAEFRWLTFASLQEALGYVEATAPVVAMQRRGGRLAWLAHGVPAVDRAPVGAAPGSAAR